MDNSSLVGLWWFWPLIIWTAVWKGVSMWHAARNNSPIWFIALLILNTVGILDILYIYVFAKLGEVEKGAKKSE